MPTRMVNTHDAKSQLSELIRAAERGDDVIVARNGHPVAKIIPWPPRSTPRAPGAWRDRVTIDDDVDDLVGPDADVQAAFDASTDSD